MRNWLQSFQISTSIALGVMISIPAFVVCPGCSPKSSPETSAPAESEDTNVSAIGGPKTETKVDGDVSTVTATPEITAGNGTSVLSGRITLDGDLPSPRKIQITKDAATCGAAGTVQDVEGEDGGVADVVIEIGGVKSDAPWEWIEPKEGYIIRQKDCQFTPNMIVVPIGKEISVYNDDPIGHNVNTGAWNQMQPAGPDPIVKPVEEKTPIKIVCNIHSWMEGWICPVQSPYYAVTDTKGNFQIQDVPPGKYRITIWHPYLGRKNKRVTIEPGKSLTLDHQYAVPKS